MKLYQRIMLIFCASVCIIFLSQSCQQESNQLPNVIILYADDMGFGDLAVQNPESKIPTPNLDKLANEGMRFTDAHSSSGICTPSRYALLTGRHHWRDFHGIVGAMGEPKFKEDQYTIARMFKDNGYSTACIGKWHLGWDWEDIMKDGWEKQDTIENFNRKVLVFPPEAYDWSKNIPGGPLERGFDYYFGDGTINFPPYAWVENDKVVTAPTVMMTRPEVMPPEGIWETRPGPAEEGWDFYKVLPTLTRKAIAYVQSRKDQKEPFFLYMPFPSPHAPIIPNEEFRGKSEAGAFGDFVYQTDWSAGEILKALEEIGESENTIVIFSADNGPEKYAYDRIQNFDHNSSNPLRGLKRDVYEGGHHVPFIVKWPGKVKSGELCEEVISQVDILKTISHIIGADLPAGLAHDSHNFADVWLGKSKGEEIREATVQNTYKDKYALRMGEWVYINQKSGYHSRTPEWVDEHFGYAPLTDPVQLYNLKEDIGQRNNLAGQMPEKVKEMEEMLNTIRTKETFTEE